MKLIATVNYDDMKFKRVTLHYDIHWTGTCYYNGELCEFISQDRTDYQWMNDNCPCCKEGGSSDDRKCICGSLVDVWCDIYSLNWFEKLRWFIKGLT